MYFPIYCPSKVGSSIFQCLSPSPSICLEERRLNIFLIKLLPPKQSSFNEHHRINSIYRRILININRLIKKIIYINSPVSSFETCPDLSKISQICFFSWMLHLLWISYYFVISVLWKNRFFRFVIFKMIRLTPSRLIDPRQTNFELTHKKKICLCIVCLNWNVQQFPCNWNCFSLLSKFFINWHVVLLLNTSRNWFHVYLLLSKETHPHTLTIKTLQTFLLVWNLLKDISSKLIKNVCFFFLYYEI